MRRSLKLQRVLRRSAVAVSVAAVAAVGTGCETKGWLDPTEVGRFEKAPLVVQILDKLVVGVESDTVSYPSAREVRAEDLVPTANDYRIGPNDLILVSIQDLAGAGTVSTPQKRVTETGNISLPYLGQISVTGLTEAEAEAAIVRAYADAQILPRAIVDVSVLDSQNRTFSMSGAITQPGQYPLLRGDLRLLDAIAMGRQPTSELGIDYIYIIRRKQASTSTPAVEPGAPGVDPLAPTSRNDRSAFSTPAYLMIQPAEPATPPADPSEDPRAAAERLARELRESRNAAANADPLDPGTPTENTQDRVIQIEDAGTQPAVPGEPPMTIIPPAPSTPLYPPTTSSDEFEFVAPSEPTDQEVIKVPYALLKQGELKYNIVIHPQDMIQIPSPPIGEYYMAPHAARPGVYSLTARKITLTQAVISAGGMDALAIPTRTEIVRRINSNQQVMVRVDLDRIFAGLEPDVFLKPDDQVRIGTNAGAIFAASLRNAFRVTYGFGFLYDRNYAPQRTNQ